MIQNISEFESEFINQAHRIWKSSIDRIEFIFEVSESPPEMASLSYSGSPYAIGDTLVRFPQRMTSRVKSKFFSLDDDKQIKIIIHEVGHIGYPKHDANFKRIMDSYGGIMSISQLEGKGFMVQKKSGSRFQTIRTFNSETEAIKYAQELAKNPNNKIRIHY